MDSSLHEVWQAAAGSPFIPTIGKDSQFLIAFVLIVLGFFLGGAFALSWFHPFGPVWIVLLMISFTDRSVVTLPVLAVPASLALAYVDTLSTEDPIPSLSNNQPQVWRGLHVLCGRSLRLRYPSLSPESVP